MKKFVKAIFTCDKILEEIMEIIMNNFQSLGFAVAWLLIGQQIKKRVQFFQKFCIPAPIIGGLLFALISLFGYMTKLFSFHFDTTLKDYWMVMFFTSIGFNASFSILKKGGLNVVKFLFCAVLLAVLQNVIAQGAAILIGFNRSLAVMLGSTSLTGGFGTAAAFAPIVDPDGSLGALSLAVAIPTCSSILSCLIAGPIVGHIITKYNFPKRENAPTLKVEPSGKIIKETKILKRAPQFRFLPNRANRATYIPTKDFFDTKSEVISEPHSVGDVDNSLAKTEKTLDSEKLLFSFMLLVIASGFGLFITNAFNGMLSGAKFPIYIGTMIVAAILRNIADGTKMFTVYMDEVDAIGNISLNLFLSMALVSLKLWQLASLALPVILTLTLQIALMYFFARFVTYVVMGRNYDAAVITAGHIGFGFAATPNAMANMSAICEKYGYSELAFFVVPIVGSLFIDLFNVLIITATIKLV